MFCPNCGVKIEDQNQKFCTSCGSEFPSEIPIETPQLRKEEVKTPPTYQRQSIPTYKPRIQAGGPGPESKKCLIFALASIGLFIIGMSIAGASLMRNFMPSYYFPSYGLGSGAVGWIIAMVLNIVGLVFGILSRVYSGRADTEPINNVERFGSVIAVFGIIMNVIPIFVIPILLVASVGLFFPFSYY